MPLTSDTDYGWSVTWFGNDGAASLPAHGRFSTALFDRAAWRGAEFVSSPNNGSMYRALLELPAAPVRARLYYAALGYGKAFINGVAVDDHELGTYTTFQERVLYDCVEVGPTLVAGLVS